jgi:hypothetical protein
VYVGGATDESVDASTTAPEEPAPASCAAPAPLELDPVFPPEELDDPVPELDPELLDVGVDPELDDVGVDPELDALTPDEVPVPEDVPEPDDPLPLDVPVPPPLPPLVVPVDPPPSPNVGTSAGELQAARPPRHIKVATATGAKRRRRITIIGPFFGPQELVGASSAFCLALSVLEHGSKPARMQ